MSQAAHQAKPKGEKGGAAKVKAAPKVEPKAQIGAETGTESGLSELAVPVYLQAKLAAGAIQRAPPSPPPPMPLPTEEKLPPGVQAKVEVGPPDDRYEQEADAVAARVQRSPTAPMAVTPLEDKDPALRRKTGAPCTDCAAPQEKDLPVQAKPAGGRASPVAEGGGGSAGPRPGGAVVRALRAPGDGQPLDPGVRARVEPVLGADLGPVRVHDDAGAAQAAESIQARAFTHGQDIWLGGGESPGDLGLMAHEAAHVVQQRDDIRRKPPPGAGAKPGGGAGGGAAPGGGQGGKGAPAGTAGAPGGGAGPAAPKSGGSAGAPSGGAAAPAAGASGQGSAPPASGGAPGAAAAPAPTPGAAPAGAAKGGGGPELLMPEPPEGLSAADRERLAATQGQAGDAAAATQEMPSPGETVEGARAAVAEPEAEAAARAAGELTATLGERAAPSPAIEELCTRIKDLIHSKRPPDEESLVQFDPRAAAESAGGELTTSVEGDAQQVQGEYDQMNQEPAGTPAPAAQALETPPGQVATPAVNASQSVPDAVPAEAVSLDADVTASSQRIDDAGMTTEPASLIDDPSNPVVQAREGQAGLATAAARDPVEVMAEQTAARDQAQGQMQGLQQQALQALQASRGATATAVGSGMVNLGTTESEMRTNAGTEARRIFTEAQTQVTNLLNPLPQTAMRHWETGIAVLSTRVEQQSTEFNNWKRERYEGVGGTALEVVEYFTGLPDWAIDWLNGIEESFGNDVCELMREISTEVNTVIATCEEIIDNANTRIAAVFAALPASLQSWAAGEQATFSTQLEGLRERATSTRDDFNQQLTQQAAQAVQTVRESIHAMRQEAQGLLGQIADAIERFADDPARFIINGLLKLVGISPAAFWGLVDRIGQVINDIADNPLNFANNLATALGQGFQRFFDNFGTHILGGFFEWLFSGLGSVGVQIPSDFSLSSLITFFLSLMGITWARIRGILARHIGEENVALLEKAYELISMLMEKGVDGIYEMIQEQLNPRTILDAVLSAAVDFLISALIRAVTPRIIAMFNPAGAIVQAIEVIYRILAWVFQNAARIFSLVETVVNGAAQLIAGNTGAMAAAVEGALARIIAPVIDFLAGFLGLGDLPDRIADTIRGFQEMVLGVIDRVVAWLAQRARALLRALGVGRPPGEARPEPSAPTATGSELRPTVDLPFGMAGAGHTITLSPKENGDIDVLMASGRPLPLATEFRKAHTALDNLRRYIATVEDPVVKELFQEEFGSKVDDLPGDLTARFQAIYQSHFPKGRDTELNEAEKARARQQVTVLIREAQALTQLVGAWGDSMGADGLQSTDIDEIVQVKGNAIWARAWHATRDRIRAVIGGFSYHGKPIQMRGSVEKGFRGDPKARVKFDERDFDVDMFVVDAEAYADAVNRRARVTFGKIFPQPAVPDLGRLSNEVRAALVAAFPHVPRIGESSIVLNESQPHG